MNGLVNFKKKMCKLRLAVNAALITGILMLERVICNATGNDYKFLTGKSNKTFDKLNTTTKETGASLYKTMRSVGVVAIMISIIICGISFSITKNANKREESKTHFLYIILGGGVVFGVLGIMAIVVSLGSGLGK